MGNFDKTMEKFVISSLLILSIIICANAFSCYSSLGQSKKWNDNGAEFECRPEAGFTRRKCVKFKTDLRPGKIIRECDHVYEKLFGYHTMNTKQEDGCYPFSTDVNGKPESGVYCMCSTELCNEGTIVWPPTSSSSSVE